MVGFVYWPVRAVLVPFLLVYFRLGRIGREHVPEDGPVILAANHSSFLDPFVVGTMTRRRMHYVAKAELFENRFLGWLISALGGFPVERGMGDREMITTALAILERGDGVVIFPEGTRVRGPRLGKPRRGLGHLALDSGTAVVPVAIVGTDEVRRGWRIRPRRVRLSAAQPLRFPQPDAASPRLARSVLSRVWPQVERQWQVLQGILIDADMPQPTPLAAPAPMRAEPLPVTAATASAGSATAATARAEATAAISTNQTALVQPPRASVTALDPDSALGRLELLADAGSLDLQRFDDAGATGATAAEREPGDEVLTAALRLDGREVFGFAQDPAFRGGSLTAAHADSIVATLQSAERAGAPVVGFVSSAGARLQEGIAALDGYGRIFSEHVRLAGIVPQVSIVCGPAAGGSAYGPALGDFVMMTPAASMFLTGPSVVRQVTREEVDMTGLGGPAVHGGNGVCHFSPQSVGEAVETTRELIGFLSGGTPATATDPPHGNGPAVPLNGRKVYDVRGVIEAIVDRGELLETAPEWAPNVVCGFARVEGRSIGVVANQPRQLAGVLDWQASEKAAGFVNKCSQFGVPLLVLVDTPGFMPGTDQESAGVIRHGASLVRAFSRASVPTVTVVLRKAFGGAFIAMNSKALGAGAYYAWPNAEIGVMGAPQAVAITQRRQIAAAADPDAAAQEFAEQYAERYLRAGFAAGTGLVDAVIEPCDTRECVAGDFAALAR